MKTPIKIAIATLMLATASVPAADVKQIWEKDCQKCHGADGKGNTRMGKQSGAKDYSDPKVQAEMKDAAAAKVIKQGLKEGGKEKMKAYDKLSDDDIKALIAHMRAFAKK